MLNCCVKLAALDWDAIYRDKGLRWELIQSRTGASIERLYSIRITQKIRAVVRRTGEFLEFLPSKSTMIRRTVKRKADPSLWFDELLTQFPDLPFGSYRPRQTQSVPVVLAIELLPGAPIIEGNIRAICSYRDPDLALLIPRNGRTKSGGQCRRGSPGLSAVIREGGGSGSVGGFLIIAAHGNSMVSDRGRRARRRRRSPCRLRAAPQQTSIGPRCVEPGRSNLPPARTTRGPPTAARTKLQSLRFAWVKTSACITGCKCAFAFRSAIKSRIGRPRPMLAAVRGRKDNELSINWVAEYRALRSSERPSHPRSLSRRH